VSFDDSGSVAASAIQSPDQTFVCSRSSRLGSRRSRAANDTVSVDKLTAGWNAINAVLFNNRKLVETEIASFATPRRCFFRTS
jgi:hypothetical protein